MKKFLFAIVALFGLCNHSQADLSGVLTTAGWYGIPFGAYYDPSLDMYIGVEGWYDGWSSDYIYQFSDDNGDPFEYSFGNGYLDSNGVPYALCTAMLPGMTSPAYVAPTDTYSEVIDGHVDRDPNGDAIMGPIGTDPNAPIGPGFTVAFDLNDPDISVIRTAPTSAYAWDAEIWILDVDGSMYIVIVNVEGSNDNIMATFGPITPIIYVP